MTFVTNVAYFCFNLRKGGVAPVKTRTVHEATKVEVSTKLTVTTGKSLRRETGPGDPGTSCGGVEPTGGDKVVNVATFS